MFCICFLFIMPHLHLLFQHIRLFPHYMKKGLSHHSLTSCFIDTLPIVFTIAYVPKTIQAGNSKILAAVPAKEFTNGNSESPNNLAYGVSIFGIINIPNKTPKPFPTNADSPFLHEYIFTICPGVIPTAFNRPICLCSCRINKKVRFIVIKTVTMNKMLKIVPTAGRKMPVMFSPFDFDAIKENFPSYRPARNW